MNNLLKALNTPVIDSQKNFCTYHIIGTAFLYRLDRLKGEIQVIAGKELLQTLPVPHNFPDELFFDEIRKVAKKFYVCSN